MIILLTFIAMVAFAANSLLARTALSGSFIDPASFTIIRLVSGAVVLLPILISRRGRDLIYDAPGSWWSAAALFVYGLSFSLAYLRLSAATGALILFASVQGGMMFWGLVQRDSPTAMQISGQVIAFCAFVYLLLPGLAAPDPIGSALMMLSGIAWAIYSLRGRCAMDDPTAETAGNFMRSALLCAPLAILASIGAHATISGISLAMVSGAITSALGYILWYNVLPKFSTAQAATVQLTVPIIAAACGAIFLSETVTLRLALVSFCIIGGTALAIWSRKPPARA